ncbi:MAG: D-glucuronyl C5-epimerase family protein, partial [Chloroflexi bacterium]|nr:D-glucuronyl C5-epimerase family protein [Chloroflexota bacterium]
MPETLNKIRLYMRPDRRYWTPIAAADRASDPMLYPLNFAPRLADGHFSHFDERGLPLRPTSAGHIHNYTRICGWALAHCSLARAGRLNSTGERALIVAADYVTETGVAVAAGLHQRAEIPGSGHVGGISAMAQGQAMSLLVRAHRLTAD